MEFELVETPREDDRGGDSRIIRDHRAPGNQSSVDPEDYPDQKDRALHIPEEEKG